VKLRKGDIIFIVIVVAIFLVFYLISGDVKTKAVPRNAQHQQVYDMLAAGKSKSDIDLVCVTCHDGVNIKFPPDHPVKPTGGKMSCHLCHRMS